MLSDDTDMFTDHIKWLKKENKLIISIAALVPLNKCKEPVPTKGVEQNDSAWTKMDEIIPKCERNCLLQDDV